MHAKLQHCWCASRVHAQTADIREFCQEQITHFKIFVRFVTEFPMTPSGKVRKFVIREIEIRERGLGEIARVQTAYSK